MNYRTYNRPYYDGPTKSLVEVIFTEEVLTDEELNGDGDRPTEVAEEVISREALPATTEIDWRDNQTLWLWIPAAH